MLNNNYYYYYFFVVDILITYIHQYFNHYICSLLDLQVLLVSFLLSYGLSLLAWLLRLIIAVDGG